MTNKWKDEGRHVGPLEILEDIVGGTVDAALPGEPSPKESGYHTVRNTETGEVKEVYVDIGQTVGEAIEKGQWKKE